MTECKVDITSDDLAAMRLVLAASERSRDNTQAWHRLKDLVESIEEQVKPAIEEPIEFGSVILAQFSGGETLHWARLADSWVSEHGGFSAPGTSCFKIIEVLRVGIGEPEPLAQWETELLGQQERREIAAAVLGAMDVDQYLIDAVANARPR